MHNAYFSSTLVSVKSKGSVSFSFNDYSSLLSERFDGNPSSCCSCCRTCCSCCYFAAARSNRLPINTSYLYGLRQSALIQCPPYKRLIFGGKDRIFPRFPVYGLDRGSYEVSCSIRERNGDRDFGRRRKGRFTCLGSEEKREKNWLGGVEDVEAVISLLSEEVSEEYLVGRDRNERLARRVELAKNEGRGDEFYRGRKKKVELEKRRNYGGGYSRGRKKYVGSTLLESNSKCEFESARIEPREEVYRKNEGREARGDKHRERTKSSSCSSYYSLSSVGESGSDEEVQDKEEQFGEESITGFWMDSSRSEEDNYKAQVVEEFNEVERTEATEQKSSATGSRVEWDCRKKSEKKLTEIATEEKKSRKLSSQIHCRIDGPGKTYYGKASPSHKQFDDTEEEPALAVNLEKGTRKLYSQMDIQDTKQSRSKWQEIKKMEEMYGINVEATLEYQKKLSSREENLTKGKSRQTAALIAGNNDLRRDSLQFTRTEIPNIESEKVSNLQRHSESRMKFQQKDETLVQSPVQQTKGRHQQRSERINGQIDLTREPEHFSELSETHDTNIKKNSTMQSETRMKNLEENSRLQYSQKDHEHHQRAKSWKGSQCVTNVSVVRASDMERHTDSLRTDEKRVNQESTLTKVVKPMAEIRDRYNQPDEKVMQIKLRKDVQKPTRVSSAHEEYSEEGSSLQASLNLVSQVRVQRTNVEEEEEELISQAILIPPPPQLLARSSQHVGSTSGFAVQEVSKKSSESGSTVLHTHSGLTTPSLHGDSYVRDGQHETYDDPLSLTTHKDALGSAHRLEESSTQFVGEFVEKARHEVSTSEMQKENTTETMVVYESAKQFKKNSGQYSSEDLQLEGRESRQSAEGSGAKGPSDDMWDVTDSFVQPQAEALEGNQAAGNAIVKRRGRSLWNIMGDIVQLQWGTQAKTPSSAARSDAKSLSSVSSETWFSGRESEKNGDENMKRVGSTMPQDAMPFHQLPQEKTSAYSQGEMSDTLKSKSKGQKLESDLPSSNVIEGRSTSKRISCISSNFEEENLDQKEDGNSSQITRSGQEVLPSTSQLPSGSSRRPPTVEAISETGKTFASESGPKFQLAHPFNSRLTEVSGSSGKDGELKHRKLQRNKQVLKDRFDEWEEAYKLESEQRKVDEVFMREALLEAKKAADTWEVPVGAVLVLHGKIIARGCNLVEELRDSTAHAEMICIREASNVLQTWRLADTTLYVTLEPCPMCAGAILQARISTLVWGAPNKLLGADGSWIRLFPDGGERRDTLEHSDKPAAPDHPFHPKMTIRRGVLAAECADVMQQFFQLRRMEKDKKADPSPPPSCLPIANQQSKILTKMQHMFHMLFCL